MTATQEPRTREPDPQDRTTSSDAEREAEFAHQVDVTSQMASEIPRGPRQLVRQVVKDYKLISATKYGATPFLVIYLIDFVQTFDSQIISVALPEIRRDLNATLTQLSVFSTIFGVVGLLFLPFIGYATDRWRRTRMVGISCVLSGVFSVGTGMAGSIPMYSAMRMLDGTGETLGNAPTGALLYDYYPIEARAKLVSLRAVIGSLSGFLLTGFSVFVLARYGWRAGYFAVAGPLILSGLLALKLKEPVRGYWERLRAGTDAEAAEEEQPPVTFGEAWRIIMGIKTLRRVLFLSPLIGFSSGGFAFLYNFYLREQFGLDIGQRAILSLPSTIIGLVLVVIGGTVADGFIKKNPRTVLVISGSLGLLSTFMHIVIVFIPSLPLYVASGFVIGLIGNLLRPATTVVSSLIISPRVRGMGLGVVGIFALPSLLLANIPPYVADTYGLRTGMLIFAPFALLSGLLSINASKFINADHRAAIAAANATNEYKRAKEAGLIRMLLLRDVDVAYDGVKVVFNVDMTIDQGETIALLGTNGAGKSTVLKAISGIVPADNGAIFFDGRDITRLPPYEIARLGIVHMPGGRAVFPSLTVKENLDLARLQLDDSDGGVTARLGRVFELFPKLRDRLDQEAGSLSGGEQQMLGLAQAFLWKPRLLMIDELSLGLSPAVVGELLEALREISALGTTIVLVEQSVNVALTVAERAIFMEKGEVRFDGRTADLLARPDILRAVYVKGSAALGATGRRSGDDVTLDRSRTILECKDLTVAYGGVKALDKVSFGLHEGEALGIVGPNGAGKTTLFDVISGFLPADGGTVWYDGVDITRLTPPQRAQLRLVRRFQDAKLFASLTVFEAVCVALDRKLDVRNTFVTALQVPAVRRGEARVKARADRLIELLELGSSRDKFVSDLSTGLRRIVDLACVMAAEPRVLLLDEPSSGIAQAEAESLGPLLRRIRYETNCSLLIIEHDMPLIRAVADELLAMVLGQTVVRGPADVVLEHPTVVDAYLGTSEEALNRSGLMKR